MKIVPKVSKQFLLIPCESDLNTMKKIKSNFFGDV